MNDKLNDLVKAAYKGAAQSIELFKVKNPEVSGVTVKTTVFATKRRPKEMAKARVRLANLLIFGGEHLNKSNAELAAHICTGIPGYVAPANLATEKFTASEKKAVKAMLSQKRMSIDLDRHNSPSKLKLAIRAIKSGSKPTVQFNALVSFSDEAVIVGTRRFPIQSDRNMRRIHVGKAMLNVDALIALLSPKR